MNASLVVVCVCAVTTGRVSPQPVSPQPSNKCDTCGKSFAQPQGLNRHRKTTTTCGNPDQKYCSVCNLYFTQPSSLTRHCRSQKHKDKSHVRILCFYVYIVCLPYILYLCFSCMYSIVFYLYFLCCLVA